VDHGGRGVELRPLVAGPRRHRARDRGQGGPLRWLHARPGGRRRSALAARRDGPKALESGGRSVFMTLSTLGLLVGPMPGAAVMAADADKPAAKKPRVFFVEPKN